jgi:hypothetical protein
MVHLTFHLNNKGNQMETVLSTGIQEFIKHHHNYEPINTFKLKMPKQEHPSDYVRPAGLFDKDEWGRGKAYIEYGWILADDASDQAVNTFQGHWEEHELALPLHPADSIFILNVRHITDWSAKEQAELEKFISGMITEYDWAYKTRAEYTKEEVSWWMSALDYGVSCGKVEARQALGKMPKNLWVCRICKITLDDRTSCGHSHNASPLPFPPEERVCEACNKGYVFPGRVGNDPFTEYDCLMEDKSILCPLIYPKPKMTRDELIAKRTDPTSMFFIAGNADMEWDTADMVQKKYSAQISSLVARNMTLMKALAQERGVGAGGFEKGYDAGYEEGKKQATDDLTTEGQALRELGEEMLGKRKQMDAENARLEEQAQSLKRAMERLRQANAPMEKKVQQLKADIVRRDNKIAELKKDVEYVKKMPMKMKMKMVLRQMKTHPPKSGGELVVCSNNIPAWALDELREERLRAEEYAKRQAQIKKQRQARKEYQRVAVEYPCIICEKRFRKNALVEQNGDLFCRQCK